MYHTVFSCITASIFPACMVVCGALWTHAAPSDRFGASGFKTRRAQASEESWSYAHRHLGRTLILLGITLAVFSIAAVMIINQNPYIILLVVEGIQVAAFACTGIETEFALRKNFDSKGHRRPRM